MARIVALGESVRVEGFSLGGATVLVAEDPDEVRRAWASLADDVAVVVLTPRAAAALAEGAGSREGVLTAVMPP